MRNPLVLAFIIFHALVTLAPVMHGQAAAATGNSTIPSTNVASKPADLSGDWGLDNKLGGIGGSLSFSDPKGAKRGKEDDIPYQPWALEKTMSEKPPTGPEAQFESTTDPAINYCEPLGIARSYMQPAKTKFVQTPDAVYILHEYAVVFRAVWLNSKHPDDPDPQWWGHSIGWYENEDTLVVDTVGFNDKVWLDQQGHPQTEKLHMIERYVNGAVRCVKIGIFTTN